MVFTQHSSKDYVWIYNDIELREMEEQRWLLTMNHEPHICESIYAAITMLMKNGFSPTFHLSDAMLNVNLMDRC